MNTWWELGDSSGSRGSDPWGYVQCGFCSYTGWKVVSHFERSDGIKHLNFDTAQCANCGNYVLAFWGRSRLVGNRYAVKQVPWPIGGKRTPSEIWPDQVQNYWVQAHDNLTHKNPEAAIVMARSALQSAARHKGAKGKDLKAEIDDLGTKQILPPEMVDWAHSVIRDTANEYTHPKPGQPEGAAKEAQDVVGYLDFLLEYVYDLPDRIAAFRKQPSPSKP